jgi:DNA-binding MarR family transcriptional regulator
MKDLATPPAPPREHDALEVANELRPLLLRLNRELRRETQGLGISMGQAHTLATIREHPGLGVVELAAHELVSAPTMSNHVDRLVAAGMVTRTRADGDGSDRRRVGLAITPEGRRALAAVRSRRTAWLASRLQRLDGDDLALVERALAPLQRVLEP